VTFSVKFWHQGPARQAVVTLRGNGQTIFRRSVALAGQPETLALQAQWEVDPSLWLRDDVTVEGELDVLPGDNRVFFSVPALRELGFGPRDEATVPSKFQYIYANHPLFHPFLSPDFGNLGDVKVLRHTRLNAPQATPLAFSETGDPLLFEATKLPGKLYVCAF